MLKKLSLWLIFAYMITSSACQASHSDGFAIYLLARNIPSDELSQNDINQLTLESEPFLSADDIISYDKTTHIIELTQPAYARVEQDLSVPVNGIPFVVCVGSERIYTGAFWTPISSIIYDGVVILQPLPEKGTTIEINLGYPGPKFFKGDDPRGDLRIINALEEEKK